MNESLRKEQFRNWRALKSGGGRHELPDKELPPPNGKLWFFEDGPNSGYFTRTVRSLQSA